jgi:Spy/CpxP family protein refolding chaperone
MNHKLLAAVTALLIASPLAFAEDPPAPAAQSTPAEQPDAAAQPPRDHIDATVVGSAKPADTVTSTDMTIADNNHGFQAGAPEIRRVTDQLHLSAQQKSQIHDAIERADAGAGALINREHDVKEMIASTTPEDPLYAKLVKEQAGQGDRWNENRDGLRRDVLAILTPAQRARFEQLEASR